MMKLEDVTALPLIQYCSKKEVKEKLIANGVENYRDLKSLVEMDIDVKKCLGSYLEIVESLLEKGKEPKIYVTPGYEDELLNVTDCYVKGSNLILWNPTADSYYKYKTITNKSIADIKCLLSRFDREGNNFLTYSKGVCDNNIDNIVNAVLMYEEQVIRQSKETDDRYINLFLLNRDKKREIVYDNLKDIVLYLICNSNDEFVWGSLSDIQKRMLCSCALKHNSRDKIVREHLIDIISNYTTLTELEKGVTKTRVLNRFIKK